MNGLRFLKSMKKNKQIDVFEHELTKFIDKFRKEFTLTYAEVIGTIEIKLHSLKDEANKEKK